LRQFPFQPRTLAAQFLRAFGLVPDFRLLQVERYFFETLFLAGIVKETPEAKCCGRAGRGDCGSVGRFQWAWSVTVTKGRGL
jgi:hypothetical protein